MVYDEAVKLTAGLMDLASTSHAKATLISSARSAATSVKQPRD